jgi:hypothetical protein
MKPILDQTGDLNGQQTHRLTTLYRTPEFVKEASSDAICGPDEGMPSRCYADPVHHIFPIHTKAATWISTLFFIDNKDNYPVKTAALIEKNLDNSARFHGIYKELQELKQEMVKKANRDPDKSLPNSDFALILELDDGTVERHYPLRNAKEVKTAASYLKRFQGVMPYRERQKMAQRILDKANDYGAGLDDLEDFTEKQAGYGVCAASDAANLLRNRASLMRRKGLSPEIRDEYEKMAQTCLSHPEQARQRDNLVKLASLIDGIDRIYGLHKEPELEKPEDVLFGVTVKCAEQFVSDHCVTITGNMYKIADLRKVALDDLRDVFGDEFADEVSAGGLVVSPEKLAEHASALPRTEAEMLDRLFNQSGIAPMAKEAAHDSSQWYNRDFLIDLAAHRS